jgi:hypothetical protein
LKKILSRFDGHPNFSDLLIFSRCKLKVGDVIGTCANTNERITEIHKGQYRGVVYSIDVETEQGSCGGCMTYLSCVRDEPYSYEHCVASWRRYAEFLINIEKFNPNGSSDSREKTIKRGKAILELLDSGDLLDSNGIIKKEHERVDEAQYEEIE